MFCLKPSIAMKKSPFFLALLLFNIPAFAQKPFTYTVWADGLVNAQLAKSSFYFLGTGVRFEVSKPLRNPAHALFVQAGGGYFFRKPTSAFTATFGLVSAGYRYQSRKAFNASVAIGTQLWNERMRLRLGDDPLAETFTNLMPSASAAIGFRFKTRYRLGLEYRGIFNLEPERTVLRNNVALAVGYSF